MPMTDKPRTSMTVTIPTELEAWLRAQADARMVSPSFLVTRALENLRAVVDAPNANGALSTVTVAKG